MSPALRRRLQQIANVLAEPAGEKIVDNLHKLRPVVKAHEGMKEAA